MPFGSVLFPSRCVICDSVLSPGEILCADCERLRERPAKNKRACSVCFRAEGDCCCSRHLYYSRVAAPFANEGIVRKAVLRMKYYMRTDKIKPFAKLMAEALDERAMNVDRDIICYIPMGRLDKFRRGESTAEELAKELGRLTGMEVKPLL